MNNDVDLRLAVLDIASRTSVLESYTRSSGAHPNTVEVAQDIYEFVLASPDYKEN